MSSFVLTSFQIVCCCSLGMLLSPNIIKFEANTHFSLPSLSVGITVATVKTNLIIIQVMFFGISVHLPANFDGICSTHSVPAQHISCQSAELGSVITPGVQLGPDSGGYTHSCWILSTLSHQSCSLSLGNQSWLGLNHYCSEALMTGSCNDQR